MIATVVAFCLNKISFAKTISPWNQLMSFVGSLGAEKQITQNYSILNKSLRLVPTIL